MSSVFENISIGNSWTGKDKTRNIVGADDPVRPRPTRAFSLPAGAGAAGAAWASILKQKTAWPTDGFIYVSAFIMIPEFCLLLIYFPAGT